MEANETRTDLSIREVIRPIGVAEYILSTLRSQVLCESEWVGDQTPDDLAEMMLAWRAIISSALRQLDKAKKTLAKDGLGLTTQKPGSQSVNKTQDADAGRNLASSPKQNKGAA